MHSIFTAATRETEHLHRLDLYFMVAAGGMLLLVGGLLTLSVILFRDKDGVEPAQESTNLRLELAMIAGPFALVIIFFFLSVRTTQAILPPDGRTKPTVFVRGHQWWWEFDYPGTTVQTANELHLPVGQRLLLEGSSSDVIHDFWVPAFGEKMDVVPGRRNHVWLTIKEPGVYEGACSEFCGQQHAWMRIRVVAHTPADYARWLAAAARPAAQPTDEAARRGAAVFAHYACADCHQIRGTLAQGHQGPDLTHFGSRRTMLAGLQDNTPANLSRWLDNPQAVKPGAHMPRFLLAPDTIRALTTYLTNLK